MGTLTPTNKEVLLHTVTVQSCLHVLLCAGVKHSVNIDPSEGQIEGENWP